MRSKHPTIETRVTISQKQSAKNLSSRIEESEASITRRLWKQECERYGVVWSDDMPQHGGKRDTKGV